MPAHYHWDLVHWSAGSTPRPLPGRSPHHTFNFLGDPVQSARRTGPAPATTVLPRRSSRIRGQFNLSPTINCPASFQAEIVRASNRIAGDGSGHGSAFPALGGNIDLSKRTPSLPAARAAAQDAMDVSQGKITAPDSRLVGNDNQLVAGILNDFSAWPAPGKTTTSSGRSGIPSPG